jgi:hypothetical protein
MSLERLAAELWAPKATGGSGRVHAEPRSSTAELFTPIEILEHLVGSRR